MVAPYYEGHLTRSLVRVPNSGSDRSAEATLMDLSRVSPVAASVPVPRNLPACLRHPSALNGLTAPEGKAAPPAPHPPGPTTSPPPPRASTSPPPKRTASLAGGSPPAKRVRPDSEAARQAKPQVGANTLVPVTVAHMRDGQAVPADGTLHVMMPVHTLPLEQGTVLVPCSPQQLLKEREKLRNENWALKQRLSLFQQLFRDKARLTSVIKTLGIQVQ